MGKTHIKFEESDVDDNHINEIKKRQLDKRKEKRLNRALRTKDIQELMEMEDNVPPIEEDGIGEV
jgi:hypothetical protein